jgi:hypothetical protein
VSILIDHRSPSIHLLGAYQLLNAFVVRYPQYISASLDVQLLGSACSYFESGMVNLCQGPEILAALQTMHARAISKVRNAIGNVAPSEETAPSLGIASPDMSSMMQKGNYGFEDLLFGYNISDLQQFWETDDLHVHL